MVLCGLKLFGKAPSPRLDLKVVLYNPAGSEVKLETSVFAFMLIIIDVVGCSKEEVVGDKDCAPENPQIVSVLGGQGPNPSVEAGTDGRPTDLI